MIQGTSFYHQQFVIPAKAGIELLPYKVNSPVLDPRLRGGDEVLGCRGRLS